MAELRAIDKNDDSKNRASEPSALLEDSLFKAPEAQAKEGNEQPVAKPRTAGEIVPDSYIVTLKDKPLGKEKDVNSAVEDVIARVMRRNGVVMPRTGADTLIFKHAITGFATTLTAQQKADLAKDPEVASIEQNRVVGINPINPRVSNGAKNGTEYPSGVLRIEGDKSPTAKAGPVDVDVAVIDTGVNMRHSELNVVDNVSFIPGAATGDDDNGHGSHVGGTIGARADGKGVIGVAPGARIWAVKVLDSSGYGTMAQVIAGVDYVTKNADKIEVANMSLGDKEQSKAFDEAISNSVAAGVSYAVAAGNESDDAKDYSPANHDKVITVSAVADSDGKGGGVGGRTCEWDRDDYLAGFSNYGPKVEIAAPGSCIESTWKAGRSGTDTYSTISGTSMASPHVAGAMALIKAKHPEYTPDQVYKALLGNAKPQNDPDWGFKGDKDNSPEPMLNVKGF